MATDATCNAYLGAESISIGSRGTQEFFALQKYDKSLNKIWETDGPRRVVPPPLVLQENILGLAVDPAGAVYAAGGTNFSLYNRPLPANCSLSGLPGFYCAGWFAAYNSSNGAQLSHSPQEFGNAATLVGAGDGYGGQGYGGIATDMYGNVHVSGSTSGPVVAGGEFETTSSDAFEMDFGPTAYFPARALTSITLTAVPNPATHGSPVTLTAKITSGGSAVTSGSVTFVSDGFAPGGYTVLNAQPAKVNASGIATCTTSLLPAGSDNVSAVYTGNPIKESRYGHDNSDGTVADYSSALNSTRCPRPSSLLSGALASNSNCLLIQLSACRLHPSIGVISPFHSSTVRKTVFHWVEE